jgi:Subtilase family
VTKWQVDVITISAGFEEASLSEREYSDLQQAIYQANQSNVLVFAAASNYGNVDQITFPASMHGNVICMFSSTGLVKQSEGFNPAPSASSRLNFCMLGEQVQRVRFSPTETLSRTSGTSVATSIAAGIAALVIDFSRQVDCHQHIPNSKKLHSTRGMCAVFKEMAHAGKDNDYDCVAPWKLLECSAATMQTWDDMKKREYICGRIHNALLHM